MAARRIQRIIAIVALVVPPAFGQLRISGQATVEFFKSGDGESQYAVDNGRATFAWRGDLFADAAITDHIAFLSNFRMLQDEVLRIDRFSIRAEDVASTGITLEGGEIDLPFGNLGEGRFPRENPFFGLPLMNEHITTLCETDYKLWVLYPGFAVSGNGVRLLDQGLYDLGVKARGNAGIFGFEVALTNGMVSATGTYSPNGLNSSGGLGKIARLTVTPMLGITLGFSYAFGPFMKDQRGDTTSALYGDRSTEYPERIAEGDVSVETGHWSLKGMAAYNRWQYLGGLNLDALCLSVESRYALTPRIYVAGRVGVLRFNTVNAVVTGYRFRPSAYSGKWDDDVNRVEIAFGYKVERNLLIKICYEINNSTGVTGNPADNVLGVQTVLSF